LKRKHTIALCGLALSLGAFGPQSLAFAGNAALAHSPANLKKTDAVFELDYAQKKRILREERQQQDRRQAAYRVYFYRKHGYYPTGAQFREWYYRSYGVHPT